MIRIVIEFAISLLDSSMIIFRRPLTLWSQSDQGCPIL
jgi:hypothetical protein